MRAAAARDLGAPPGDDALTAYVAVERGRAVGLCVVEPVSRAVGDLGVAALWVLASKRRRGVATALVDAARARFSGAVARGRVATTHLTQDGAAFFGNYGSGAVYSSVVSGRGGGG